jgi:hypothetical protein
MNKRTVIANLNKIANELDTNGLYVEANEVTKVMVKLSQSLIGNSGFGAGGNVPAANPIRSRNAFAFTISCGILAVTGKLKEPPEGTVYPKVVA